MGVKHKQYPIWGVQFSSGEHSHGERAADSEKLPQAE